MVKNKKVKEALVKKLTRLITDYPENEFGANLELVANLAGFNTPAEMLDNDLSSALDSFFDQSEINDLFIDINAEYESEDI